MMNLAAFAVIVARERETDLGDSIQAVAGLGRSRPWLAWPLTLSMLGLAGIPATAGFVGKFYLIDAAVSGNYTWLGVVIVIGSMISLAYYLPVVAAMWMRDASEDEAEAVAAAAPGALPAIAGGSPELDVEELPQPAGRSQIEVIAVAVIAGTATLFFGIVPQPLFDLVQNVGRSFGLL
jgi:NADH-quinone oxidoreductase subunit N